MHVPLLHRILGAAARQQEALCYVLAELETRHLRARLAHTPIDRPIFVCGLARSGSTILLELLSRHPRTATYRYRDYPFPMLPFYWGQFTEATARRNEQPRERSHADGIAVTPRSPEAMEEMLWMHFLPSAHTPSRHNTLSADSRIPGFKAFYTDTIRKLLLVRGADRYLAKNNYNLVRLPFLLNCFPDARFVVPVRDPVWHIASLMKQHRLLSDLAARDRSVTPYMRHVGHFEFGGDMRPLNTGDTDTIAALRDLWARGHDVEAWARYWRLLHAYLLRVLRDDPTVADAVLPVVYRDLCEASRPTLRRLYAHVALAIEDDTLAAQAADLRAPTYYQPAFSTRERKTIHALTDEVYAAWLELAAKARDDDKPSRIAS